MKLFSHTFLALSLFVATFTGNATDQQKAKTPDSDVSFEQFARISLETSELRRSRMVDFEKFLEMAKDPKTVILDTRSKDAFDEVHLKDSVHLNFSDFAAEKLAKVLPDPNARILIYCNNNFAAEPAGREKFLALANKAPGLALNIPTFINLHGYGYKNVFELSELLDVNDPRLVLEGTAVKK